MGLKITVLEAKLIAVCGEELERRDAVGRVGPRFDGGGEKKVCKICG